MLKKNSLPSISADDFARRFSLRAEKLMWFLGAGASASAGLPTAMDMIWEFKQKLFVSQRRGSADTVADLSQINVRIQLQAHIDSLEHLPQSESPDEYAALFEAVYPAESDRRAFLDAKLAGAKPSYGHMALATLMRGQQTRLVWTTNFDTLVDDACAKVFDTTSALTTVDLDRPELGEQAISGERWPVEIKLHGDFRSRRLKNTDDELRHQDTQLRRALIDSCKRHGLVVIGYSGRDDSIMDALEEAVKQPGAFPSGLFWLSHGESVPLPRVVRFLERAVEAKVEASLVSVDNFDEILRDLIRLINGLETKALDDFSMERPRWSRAPKRQGRGGWPVVRLNALPIVNAPNTCRRVGCQIGGTAEVREAVDKAGVEVLAVRSQFGVLAFGADSAVRATFDAYGITEFDLHTLETKRLWYESTERGLLCDALVQALRRYRSLDLISGRRWDLVPTNPQDVVWKPLQRLVGRLDGMVKNHSDLQWREGITVRLDYANGRLWLLIEPRTIFEEITVENKSAAANFSRERTVRRYNPRLNELIDFWAQHLAGNDDKIRALNVGDGIDAVFQLSSVTGFSRRISS